MSPIPGHIVDASGRVMDIAGKGLSITTGGFAIRWLGEISRPEGARPEGPRTESPVMPERVNARRTRHRMRRPEPSTRRSPRIGKCLVRDKHKRDCAERRDQSPIHSVGHVTHQLLVTGN
jgi:hypothetical protein